MNAIPSSTSASPRTNTASGTAPAAACIQLQAAPSSESWPRLSERILELGCGLGYSALCLAHGSGGHVQTIERDLEHARIAEGEIASQGYGERIRVLQGRGREILPDLDGPYDLIFSDGDPEEMPFDLEHFLRLLRRGGLLVSANLFLAQFVADLTGVEQMAECRQRVLDDARLVTAIVPGGLAISVVRGTGARVRVEGR